MDASDGQKTAGTGGQGIRAKRRHTKAIMKEGLEAALRASPERLERCKPKTNLGAFVRGIVLEACKGKATPMKQVMTLLDWPGPKEEEGEEIPDDTEWDWTEDGVWETRPEAAPEPEEEAMEGPHKQELTRRLERLLEVGDYERVGRILATAQSGGFAQTPPPAPS